MLRFINNFFSDSLKKSSMSRASGFYIFGPQSFLSSKTVSSIAILCFQLGSLVSKGVLVFPRTFFLELAFKKWLLALAPLVLVVVFFV